MATKSKVTHHSDRRSHYTAAASREESAGDSMVMDESGSDQMVDEVPGTRETPDPMSFGAESSAADRHRRVSSPTSTGVRKTTLTESAAEADPTVDASFGNLSSSQDEHEFWGAISRAIAPFVLTTVKKTGVSLAKSAVRKVSPTLASMLRLEGFAESAIQRLESEGQESGEDASAQGEQEFWGSIASALVPVLTPYAKRIAGAAIKTGGSWARRIFESGQESGAETEALSQQLESLFMEQAASDQESGSISSEEQQEFWGSIARKLVPVLAPVAKAVTSAAMSAGKSIVTGGIKRLSPTLAQMLRLEGFTEAAIQRLEMGQQESGSNGKGTGQQEFWGAIAGAIVPVLMPHAKKLAGVAVKKGSSWIRGMFESSEQESGAEMESTSQQLENLFLQHAASGQESGSISYSDQQEFWGAIARRLVPVFSPIAKAAAGAAVNAGASWIRSVFESGEQESGGDMEGMSQQFEELLVQEALSANLESGTAVSVAEQQEFWGAIARKLMPVLAPVAKNLAGAAFSAGKSVIAGGIRTLSPTVIKLLRSEGVSESAIQQLQSGQESGNNGMTTDREFWGTLARTLVPVLKPFVKKIGRPAVSAGGRLVASAINLFETGSMESTENGGVATEASLQQFEAMEVIIDRDDRTPVVNTTSSPFNRICHLSIKAADGSSFLGTGFFIGPRTIATAGHCVYQKDHGGWPQQIVVSPGRNGSNKPFGQFIATQFCSVQGWINNLDRDCDYGVIQLPRNANVPPQIGCFGFGIFSDSAIASKQLTVTGYPGDKPSGTMMQHSRKPTSVNPTTVVYDIDTVGGQSGSAVYDENRRAVAIHTNGATTGNSGTRITQTVFNNLIAWRAAGSTL